MPMVWKALKKKHKEAGYKVDYTQLTELQFCGRVRQV